MGFIHAGLRLNENFCKSNITKSRVDSKILTTLSLADFFFSTIFLLCPTRNFELKTRYMNIFVDKI